MSFFTQSRLGSLGFTSSSAPIPRRDSFSEDAPILQVDSSVVALLTQDVAQPIMFNFDRSKATAEYSAGQTIKYTFIGVVRSLAPRFFKNEAENLELYKEHKAFNDGIEKVSKSYQQYRAAEKAVKDAPAVKLRNLRIEELKKADALVARYNELIALASNRRAGSQAEHQQDVHQALENKDHLIFHTVNKALAKIMVGNGLGDDLPGTYQAFVTNFAEHVQMAVAKTGLSSPENIQAITDAFSEGLASFPELSTGVDVILMHAKLEKLRDPNSVDGIQRGQARAEKAEMTTEVVEHFTSELMKLMNGDQEITRADLERIHCQGIPLLQVRDFTKVQIEELENLRKLAKEHQKISPQLETLQTCQKGAALELATKATYRASVVASFLEAVAEGRFERTPGSEARTLETARDEHVLTDGFSAFQDIHADYTVVNKKYEELKKAAAVQKGADDAKIKAAQQVVDDLSAQINTLTNEQLVILDLAQGLKDRLVQSDAEYQIGEEEFRKRAVETPYAYKYFYVYSKQTGEDLYKAEVKAIKEKIAELDAQRIEKVEASRLLINKYDVAKQALEDTKGQANANEINNKRKLLILIDRREKCAERTVQLSSEEIRSMAEYLGVGSVSSTQSSVAAALVTARETHERKMDLEGRIHAFQTRVDEIDEELAEGPEMLELTASGEFEVNSKQAFGDDETASIQEMIDENLEIAAEVTARVAGSLAERIKIRREEVSARQEIFEGQIATGRQSQFEFDAERLEAQAMEDDKLVKMISDRIALFPKQVEDEVVVHMIDEDSVMVTKELKAQRLARISKMKTPFTGVQPKKTVEVILDPPF